MVQRDTCSPGTAANTTARSRAPVALISSAVITAATEGAPLKNCDGPVAMLPNDLSPYESARSSSAIHSARTCMLSPADHTAASNVAYRIPSILFPLSHG